VKNHLTVTSLQPRGLVALISSLGTFSASWNEIEELNLEIENNEKINNGSDSDNNDSNNNNNNNNDNDIKLIINDEDNINKSENKSQYNNESKNENKNTIGNNRNTLSFVFSETAERYFPDLSNAEVFQVRHYPYFYIFIVFFFVICFLYRFSHT
jgi:uncharacterized membrane protein